ncbi:efflux RND transporter periplasmic adaptor subunit [Citrobacter portucalensis]|uniref:efflux RND transporter periplasmic adaptor subunit n=1 Tax=Citrobacter portucalensis TaxID=1639133 RepID=UPI00226B9AA9|nr:efflux RND transporter periplasmic adaptor subunit [Citrobacter portucalensis]MCX8979081.1 efflux RND transporter periplasmic adaptor subunit [Citrobacter portucalensis]MCX9009171.1 efflux RND transporter periplasmic adaptor subunit [Citrobacter portucalensis]
MMQKQTTKISVLSLLWLLTACDSGSNSAEQPQEMPANVTVQTLTAGPVNVEQTFPGRVAAYRIAQIRPQVSGIVTEMKFSPGSELIPGQALFQIDPAPFKADVNSAAASLQKAQASYRQLQAKANRLSGLTRTGAISQQDYEDALSSALQAKAAVAEARATLERRQLDLAYATVKTPIGGRVDQNFITEGALVSTGDTQALATVQQIDKVYVDVRQPAAQQRALTSGAGNLSSTENTAQATILAANGEPFSNKADILFTGVSVDAGTGDVVMRLLVDNPQRTLLPGMYAQAKISHLITNDGITIPREAVVRENNETKVWLNQEGKAKAVVVQLGEAIGANYYVRQGVNSGDQLITQGLSRLQDGMALQLAQDSAQ